MPERLLFARVGWMRFYAGAQDERPVGGGSYNKKNVGSELFNFRPVGKYLYGYVKGGSGHRAINLRRMDPVGSGTDSLKHVTVIFVARDPRRRGQRVIGWYREATVFGSQRIHPLKTNLKKVYHCLQGEVTKARLLPTSWRNKEVPSGKGGMGQSNVCYARAGKVAGWMRGVLKYVDEYDGPNLLHDKSAEADQSELLESVIETAAGFETNPKIRQAIEEWAMRSAREHYRAKEFTTQDILKGMASFLVS